MEREPPRGKARLPSLLLALLGLGPELLFGQARAAAPRPVHGVLGGSVLLSPALPPNRTVKEIEWSFSAGTGATIQVAEVGPGGFERPDPRDRFGGRLEPVNGTALRLRQLQRGDSGVFAARIKLQPALVDDQAFNLTVYEAVPSPRTRSQLLASTLDWCNLTLQCQGSGRGAVNVTWRRDSLAWAEPGPGRHQLSPDGTTLRVALPPAATNVTYACTVSNPADRKVALFHLHSLCQGAGGHSAFSTSGYVVLALILVAVSLGGAFWCWRVNSEKAARAAATPTAPPEESPGEPQYSDIVCRSPPEGNDQGPSAPEALQEPSAPQKSEPGEPQKSEPDEPQKSEPGEPQKSEPGEPQKSEPGEPQKSEAAAPKASPGGDERSGPEDAAQEVT
nr:SLAM family member 5 [Taeniopygia guttata]